MSVLEWSYPQKFTFHAIIILSRNEGNDHDKLLEAVKHQLHQFVETGHSKPVHLMQNQLINDIYHAIDHNQMVMLTSNQKTYKGYINRYDRERQAIFIEQDKIISIDWLKENQNV